MIYSFDTETYCDGSEAWIWSWALCDENMNVETGNGLDVLHALTSLPDGSEVWIHNLPYDAEFLFWELLKAGYRLVYDLYPRDKHHGVFDMLCDLNGCLSMAIYTRGRRVILRDSIRIFRAKLEKLPKMCGFEGEEGKLKMDYTERRERDHVPTSEELAYQIADVRVLMRAMKWIRAQSPKGNTVGSIAVYEFKKSLGNKAPFTPLTLEERKAYSSLYNGGVVALSEKIAGVALSVRGRTYDRNSMYPAEAWNPIPVRISERYFGEYRTSKVHAFHILASDLKLKDTGFPLLITPFTGKARTVIAKLDKWLYADEWEAIREDYDIGDWKILSTLVFDVEPVARPFVEKWYAVKVGQPELKTYAKFILNNITGKWGENAIHEQMRRHVTGDDYVNYRYNEIDATLNPWTFMPAVAFVTSQARLGLREAAFASGRENLLYTDTDSIHTSGILPPEMVDATRLGAWKIENEFDRALYVKPKSYYEAEGEKTTACKHAGLNYDATLAKWDDRRGVFVDTGEEISADNMKPGAYFFTKQNHRIKGGIIIERKPKIL